METIEIFKGEFVVPDKFQSLNRVHIRTPWMVKIYTKAKDKGLQGSVIQYFRHKGRDKPYIPEGFIDINKERFKVIETSK